MICWKGLPRAASVFMREPKPTTAMRPRAEQASAMTRLRVKGDCSFLAETTAGVDP
jgi:hypothetical protein